MTITQSSRSARVAAAHTRTPAVAGGRTGGHRARVRLWALLNAQALMNGTLDGGDLSEDDRWRMAARRAN